MHKVTLSDRFLFALNRLLCKLAAESSCELVAGIAGKSDKEQTMIKEWMEFESSTLKVCICIDNKLHITLHGLY